MKKLIQIIYISRSTFESTEVINIIEPNVARILAKSRINNRKNGLVGVLYFGDGAFFQCLEGEEDAVNNLLTKLEDDPRHKDLKIISKKYINQLSFGNWAMKFAPLDEQITKFLRENGFKSFDPYLFSGEIINQFLNQLITVYDSTNDINLPYSLNSTVIQEEGNIKALDSNQIKSNLALIFSIIALIFSLLTFLSSHNQL
jgi:hypothetical protein